MIISPVKDGRTAVSVLSSPGAGAPDSPALTRAPPPALHPRKASGPRLSSAWCLPVGVGWGSVGTAGLEGEQPVSERARGSQQHELGNDIGVIQ